MHWIQTVLILSGILVYYFQGEANSTAISSQTSQAVAVLSANMNNLTKKVDENEANNKVFQIKTTNRLDDISNSMFKLQLKETLSGVSDKTYVAPAFTFNTLQ